MDWKAMELINTTIVSSKIDKNDPTKMTGT